MIIRFEKDKHLEVFKNGEKRFDLTDLKAMRVVSYIVTAQNAIFIEDTNPLRKETWFIGDQPKFDQYYTRPTNQEKSTILLLYKKDFPLL